MRSMKKLMIAVSFCFAALLIANPMKVQAKNPAIVNLKAGKTYKSYDVTGDKKNDVLKITTPKNKYGNYSTVKITVNKKTTTLNNSWDAFSISTKLVTLKNNKAYVWISGNAENDDDPWQVLYQYKNGRMVNAVDFMTVVGNYASHIGTAITGVNGNTIAVNQGAMTSALGGINYNLNYTYQNGVLKKTSSVYKIKDASYYATAKSKYGTMRNTKAIYKDAACTKKIDVIKKNTKAAAVKVYLTGKTINVKIKTKDGKIGWLKGTTQFKTNRLLFKECYYAG